MACTFRKNRNLYGQLMLHMLKRGVLEGPFTSKPQEGPLPTLPQYMVRLTWQVSYRMKWQITRIKWRLTHVDFVVTQLINSRLHYQVESFNLKAFSAQGLIKSLITKITSCTCNKLITLKSASFQNFCGRNHQRSHQDKHTGCHIRNTICLISFCAQTESQESMNNSMKAEVCNVIWAFNGHRCHKTGLFVMQHRLCSVIE